jgi:hypothetical protein
VEFIASISAVNGVATAFVPFHFVGVDGVPFGTRSETEANFSFRVQALACPVGVTATGVNGLQAEA